jgi:hypothetical protein
MLTLTIPPKRDPIARLTLLGCAALVCYAVFASATAPQQASAQAEQDPIIIVATPALPTPALAELPLLGITEPTPQTIYVEVPGPTPPPEVVYVEVQAQAAPTGDPQPFAPSSDLAMQPGTPEFNAALADIYSDLPTIQCPCGVLEPATEPHVMTDAEKAYSRARTR